MAKLTFKTTISCGGCVAKVKNIFDSNSEIKSWDVDIANPDKILTVESETLTAEQITESLSKIGFKAEQQ